MKIIIIPSKTKAVLNLRSILIVYNAIGGQAGHIKLYFKPKGLDYEWNSYSSMDFPYEFYKTPEELSKQLKSWHIYQLQMNDDTEHLSQIPDEDIKNYST